MSERYRSGVLAAYEGERQGAATFALLAESTLFTPTQRATLTALARLEQLVADRLGSIVRRMNLSARADEEITANAAARAASVRDWDDLVATMGPRLEPFTETFERLLALCEPDDRPAMALLCEHERALMAFARAEAAGDPDAIGHIVRLLRRNAPIRSSKANRLR